MNSLGLIRSLVIYWRPGRQRALQELYRPFVGSGDLVFDVGAHIGDRTAAFAALGARVVALEPQPRARRWLVRLAGRRGAVTVRPEAVGRTPGKAQLQVSGRTPTVSTLDPGWARTMTERNPGFRRVRWDRQVEVSVTTLDRLVEEYGMPVFCKIDVEGHEAEVLRGLSRPIPALSVEFVAGSLHVAAAAVEHIEGLAPYEFNAVTGEERSFLFPRWRTGEEIRAWLLQEGAESLPSGDLYARRWIAGDGSDGAP